LDDLIANWWIQFQAQAPHIDRLFKRKEEWDLPEWMAQNLQVIHPELMWEFGPARRGFGHRLVITPESRRELRPLVREILRRAPQIEGWEFYDYRLAEEFDAAAATVQGRVGGDIGDLEVQVQPGAFNRVDLLYLGFPAKIDEGQARAMAFVASESLLGEEVLDRWIGGIDVATEPATEADRPIAIADLPARVTQLIAAIRESLPERPWFDVDFENDTTWSSLTAERDEADDYPELDDLLVAITPLPGMIENALSANPFDSIRYSRCGERFCYLKIDGLEGLEGSSFADRAEIEDAINAVLRPAKVGAAIGGGTGRRYSYVELALTDLDRSWRELRLVLQDGRLPTRTWLLFHDDELRSEWRGLYDDTPEPPARAVEPDPA
jgi:hypothetical protein